MITLLAVTSLKPILLAALLIFVVILVLAGLIWCIEKWISPVPAIAKLIVALIILVGIVFWALGLMGIAL